MLRACLALIPLFSVAQADSSTNFWNKVGTIGGPIFWVGGLGSSLIQDGHLGIQHTARTADGMILTIAVSEGLDLAVREKRPYGNGRDSFPSDHSALSFAVAASQSYFHPKEAIFWYAGASLISYSRIPAHEHTWLDVIAGAAIGYGAGQLSASRHRGLLIAPCVESGRLGIAGMFATRF